MKQFQFEVKNHNNLKKELARVKRFAKNEYYSSIFFQIFTMLEDFDEIKQITDIIDQDFPEAFYYGCQTFGNIMEGKLSQHKTLIVCSFFEFDTTQSKVVYINPVNPECEYLSLQDLWDFCNKNSWVKGVELITSYKGGELLGVGKPIEDLREDVEVFGGVAINPHDMGAADTYIFAKGYEPSEMATIAVIVGGPDFHIKTTYVRGWEGLGKKFEITKCDGKRVQCIDNAPAMDIYRKYLNIEQDENFMSYAILFPLLVEHNGIECIRVPFPCENPDEFDMVTEMEKGLSVRLSYGEKHTILRQAKAKMKEIAPFAPDAVRIFSCASRLAFWGEDEVGKETQIFDDLASAVGFYTRGEIIRIDNFLHYLNSTMAIALFREGEAFGNDYDIDDASFWDENVDSFGEKLINYISAVTGELEGQYHSTMRGIANIYKHMFLIDSEEREIIQLDNDEAGRKILEEKDGYSSKMKHFLRNTIVDSMLYQAMMFCDFHTLKARLRYKDAIDCELISKKDGWFRAQFVVVNRDSNGIPNKFVFTSQIIDAEKKASEEQRQIIQALADTYFTLHVFDLKTDVATEVNTEDIVHRIYTDNRVNGCQATLTAAMKQTCAEEFLKHMLEFTDFSTLKERLAGRKAISTEFYGFKGWAKATLLELESDEAANLTKVLFATQIINDEKRKEEGLVKDALTDELTGLFNRRAYEMDIQETEKKGIDSTEFVVCTIDVNGLKTVNDTAGHEAGDELITGAANCIKQCLGTYGKAYRIGGDEFFAIMYIDKVTLETVKEDFNRTVIEWKGKLNNSLSVASGYVSSIDFAGKTIHDMTKTADRNMYAAKEEYYKCKGKDRRGQKHAYEVLCESYAKILMVNLSKDTFKIIKADNLELTDEKGYDKQGISKWLHSFADSGQVHEDYKDKYIEKTSIDYLREYFDSPAKTLTLHYKRKFGDEFRDAIMEIMPAREFSTDNKTVFLYVKDISDQ